MISKVHKKFDYDIDFSELDTANIDVDTFLPYDVYIKQDDDLVIVIKAGTLIDKRIYNILLSHSIYMPIEDDGKQYLNCQNLEEYVRYAKSNSKYCIDLLYKMNDVFFENFYGSKDYSFNAQDVDGIVRSIIFLVQHNENFVKDNIKHFRNDSSLKHHSLHVCIYTIYLGNALDFIETELLDLGVAGYLQDIGLKKIDQSIVAKDSSLSIDEMEDIQKHTLYSIQIVKHNRIHRPDIINGIKHHHENYDGSGYPDRLNSSHISKFAAVLSICDVFDALTCSRPYRKEMSSFEALTHMMKDTDMAHRFNHQYIKTFIKLLAK